MMAIGSHRKISVSAMLIYTLMKEKFIKKHVDFPDREICVLLFFSKIVLTTAN